MKKAERGHTWFFVDESGDPTFYDRNGNLIVGQAGCSSILILGFVEMRNPRQARRAIQGGRGAVLQRQIEGTDAEIDGLVYELYGLTEEEIAIVEGAEKLR